MFKIVVGAAAAVAGFAFASAATQAADVSIVSMQYSVSHPVPHFHYEGGTDTGDVEKLKVLYDRFVHCRTECIGPEGGSTAVLTFNGPGGNYRTGLALADFLRANHIATVAERGSKCYSACAFAFLGGSGYSSQPGVGTYVDRMVEPGSIVGFHAPYFDNELLISALEERTPAEILGFNRSDISLMVKELVKWNVDPEIVFHMVDMGPEQTYDLLAADDLYLVRTALPPAPASSWITDVPGAVRNACLRLLALYERTDPLLLKDVIDTAFESNIGQTEFGDTLSGYRLSNDLLSLGHCSVNDSTVASGDLEIALYMNAGITGASLPLVSMFNRQDGFSTAGVGGNPVKRVFQKGALNHWFLPVGVNIDALDLPGEFAATVNRFFTIAPPAFPEMPTGLETISKQVTARVSLKGNVWILEEVGGSALFEAARAESAKGLSLTMDLASDSSFIREGTFADGTQMLAMGYQSGAGAAVVHAIVVAADGSGPTDADQATLNSLICDTVFDGMRHGCN